MYRRRAKRLPITVRLTNPLHAAAHRLCRDSLDWVLRVSAVSYLNTAPLIWGFQNGPDQGLFDIRFELPAQCAAALESGAADIGLLPSAELDRLQLDFLPDLGIACEGPVRSILLISRKP